MQFNTTWAKTGKIMEPDMTTEPAPPDGQCRTSAHWDTPTNPAPQPGDPVTVTLTYAPIPEPSAPVEPPAPVPNVPAFMLAARAAIGPEKLGAILVTPTGALLTQALQIGDWDGAQADYNTLKAAPPAPATADDLAQLAQLAAAHNIPITP